MRLDIKLAEDFKITRIKAQKLIENKGVIVNNKIVIKSSLKVNESDEIKILSEPEEEIVNLKPEDIPLDIIFEDEYLMVINKQAGVATHPPSINGSGTIANGVAHLIQGTGFRAGIVHRLDKETTGLLIIAKTENSAFQLSEMIAKREVERKYLAICYGTPIQKSFQINARLIRDAKNRLKMVVCKTAGKEAITNVLVKENFKNDFSLLELKLETGRTHQIRLHLSHYGNPIVGDQTYSPKPPSFFNRFHQTPELQKALIETKRQMLHAFSLEFKHPITSNFISLKVEPPLDFQNLLNNLQNKI